MRERSHVTSFISKPRQFRPQDPLPHLYGTIIRRLGRKARTRQLGSNPKPVGRDPRGFRIIRGNGRRNFQIRFDIACSADEVAVPPGETFLEVSS